MKTTSVFIDILIVGLLATIWICCFIFTYVLSPDYLSAFLKEESIAVLVIMISVTYSNGILFDYINSWVFGFIRSKRDHKLFAKISIVKILDYSPDLQRLLDNHYSRLRIARAHVLHILPITFSLIAILNHESVNPLLNKNFLTLITLILGFAFFSLSIISYRLRSKEYRRYMEHTLDLMKN